MIRKLFSSRSAHPLAEAREVKRLIAGLPLDNAFDAVDQISLWLESLRQTDDWSPEHFFDVLCWLDEAAQPHLQRLGREYINASRPSKNEERRLWAINHHYWVHIAEFYAQCVERFINSPPAIFNKVNAALSAHLPLTSARLLAARAAQLKWLAFRYVPASAELWSDLGRAYLIADALGYAETPVPLYAEPSGESSVAQQYLKALVLHASSMNCLMPFEIELADRLIEYLLPGFVFSADSRSDSVYWVDSVSGKPPLRLARQPLEITMSMRFFSPGNAPQALNELIHRAKRGELPEGLRLGRPAPPKQWLAVLKHLARYWAAQPPLREHPRHAVKTRCAVVHGFNDCHAVLLAGERDTEVAIESWQVDNVSFGGFGTEIDISRSDWPKLGALLCVQPDGGLNWVLTIVRRYGRRSETQAWVGIQSLSRQATGITLHLYSAGIAAVSGFPGIWLRENSTLGEVRIVLPSNRFNLQQNLAFTHEQQRTVLTPLELEENASDYQVARYRELLDLPSALHFGKPDQPSGA